MTMVLPWSLLSLVVSIQVAGFRACSRITWTAVVTSCCWLAYASRGMKSKGGSCPCFQGPKEIGRAPSRSIPRLLVDFLCQFFTLEVGMTLHPRSASTISVGKWKQQNLRNKCVWV